MSWCEAMSAELALALVCAPVEVVAAAVTAKRLDRESAAWVRKRLGPGAQGAGLCRFLVAVRDADPEPSMSPLWWEAVGAVGRAARTGWKLPAGDSEYYVAQVERASLLEDVALRTGADVTVIAELAAPGMGVDDLVAIAELVTARS